MIEQPEQDLEELKVVLLSDIRSFAIEQSPTDSLLYNVVAQDEAGEFLMLALHEVTYDEAVHTLEKLRAAFGTLDSGS